jgi:hypothetical protein
MAATAAPGKFAEPAIAGIKGLRRQRARPGDPQQAGVMLGRHRDAVTRGPLMVRDKSVLKARRPAEIVYIEQ